ncbi:MAG: S1 RNA-binding domain-containing protein [Solobacterium sp.]|nr:S1 RNA-binding domain-containing protein [Solobacterium sp.]
MQYRIGQTVEGKVTGIQPYGAFVMLDRQTCGLIHISEISDGYVRDISRYVKVGDTITVKIIDFDAAANQARLSLKALHRTHSRSRRRPMNRKAELPVSNIGFSSIAGMMKQWVTESEKGEGQL